MWLITGFSAANIQMYINKVTTQRKIKKINSLKQYKKFAET